MTPLNSLRLFTASAAAIIGFGSTSVAEDAKSIARPWAHESSDLKPDASIKWGKLDNGLRYVIMPNAEPPNRVSLRLYVDAGSLMEDDNQRGLAHFLEHMAFNGTENFPAGEMIEYFQRLGMAFGADTNAHTSFKETVYKLELPKAEEKLMRQSFQLFADYAGKMLLAEKEIDKERGVILSEKLSRDSVRFRMLEEGFKFALPEAKISSRMPIGTKEVIESAPRERFVDFYSKWYTTDRMVVVVVGDVETAKVEPLITEYFKGLEPPAEVVADPDFGKVSQGRGVIAKFHSEPEMPYTDISIEVAMPSKKLPDNAANRKANLRVMLANRIINRRMEVLAKKEGAQFLKGSAYHYDYLKFVELAGMNVTCKPETWEGGLAAAERELRRALEYGFTQAEFDQAKANVLNAYQQSAKQAGTRRSKALADAIVNAVGDEAVFTDPASDLLRMEKVLGELTPKDCLEGLREAWQSKEVMIFVGGNAKLDTEEAEEKILAVYRKSAEEKVEPPVEKELKPFAYTDFGGTGKVASLKEVEDLGATQIAFENNVRLNVKQTDFEDNVIRVMVRFGGGKLEIPIGKPGLSDFTSAVFDAGGLEAHSAEELERLFAGKTVGASFGIGNDAFTLSGRTNAEDLQMQMQLLAAYMTAPGYREEAQRQFRQGIDGVYKQFAHTLEGAMKNVSGFLRDNDPRFVFPKKAELEARNLEEVKAWLSDALTNSYVEITIVGDVTVDQAVDSVANTFGALPKRAEKKPDYTEERKVSLPKEHKEAAFSYTSEIPRAAVYVFWPTDDMSDINRTRRLNILGSVFSDRIRLKVREEMGEAYSPSCYHSASETFTGFGFMAAVAVCRPDQAEVIGKIAKEISEQFKTGEISDDEFDRAIKPQLTKIDQTLRDNSYWMGTVLAASQENPERLDWARDLAEDYKAITKEDLEKLAKEYLSSDKAIQVVVKPVKE